MADLITLVEGAFLGKFVGPAAEHYGKVALERAQQVGAKAYQFLRKAGREPEPVELKVLIPLVQAASLEADPDLADKWAALLANAADPAAQVNVQPVFAEILKQLTPKEAKLLDELFNSKAIAERLRVFQPDLELDDESRVRPDGDYLWRKSQTIAVSLDLERVRHERGNTGVDRSVFESLVDNLFRHRLLIPAREETPKKQIPNSFDLRPDIKEAYFSALGFDFMLACTPPKKTEG